MWIKICGITSLEDAEFAIAAGADALGFVFAESPRRIAPQAVREITTKLPGSIEKIGVFVDATLEEATAVRNAAGLTGVQLHGSCDVVGLQDPMAFSSRTPMRVLQVVRYHADPISFARELHRLHESSTRGEDAVLVDTWSAAKQGGTGCSFDWLGARDSFHREAPRLRLIAAGGLRPENVREAILTLQPWGVDVSSGVEARPGKKDPDRVTAFISAARAAEMELLYAQ